MRFRCFILLAFFSMTAAGDTVVLRDGSRKQGKLTFCDEQTCTLSKKQVDRREVALIVFRDGVALPSNVRGVVFEDGSVRGGAFTGLTLGYVELNGEEIDRERVAAIILDPLRAPPPETAPPPIVRPAPPPATPSPPSTPPSSAPRAAPPTAPAPQAVPPTAFTRCGSDMRPANGAAWTGTAKVRQQMAGNGWSHERTAELTARLREKCDGPVLDLTATPYRPVGRVLVLEGSVEEREKYSDVGGTCVCEGENTHTASMSYAMIWQRTADGDATRFLGFNLPAHRQPFYVLTLGGEGNVEAPCRGESCGGTAGATMLQLSAGRLPMAGQYWDQNDRLVEGGVLRGTYTIPLGPATHQVAWSICREGVQCPPPPEFERTPSGPTESTSTEEEDPCGEMQQIRAPLDLAMDQQSLYLQQLQQFLRELGGLQQQASQWKNDFDHATRDCNLWSAAQTLIGLLLSGGAPGVGTGVFRPATEVAAGKQFYNLLSLLQKLANGDPSWLLPNHEFGPGEGWASLEDAWDAFMIGYGQLDAGSPQSLRQGLQDCGAPTIDGVLDGAYQYLRLLEQIEPLARRMNEAANRVRQQDIEMLDKWMRYKSECQEYQRCKGGDAGACDAWPPAGPIAPGPPPR